MQVHLMDSGQCATSRNTMVRSVCGGYHDAKVNVTVNVFLVTCKRCMARPWYRTRLVRHANCYVCGQNMPRTGGCCAWLRQIPMASSD